MRKVLSKWIILEAPRTLERDQLQVDPGTLEALGCTRSRVKFPEAPVTLIKKRVSQLVYTVRLRVEGLDPSDTRTVGFHVHEGLERVISEGGEGLLQLLGFCPGEFVSRRTFLMNYQETIEQALITYISGNARALERKGQQVAGRLSWTSSHPLLWPTEWLSAFTLTAEGELRANLYPFIRNVMESVGGRTFAELLEDPETGLAAFTHTLMESPSYRSEDAGLLLVLSGRVRAALRETDSLPLRNRLQAQEIWEQLSHASVVPTEVIVRKRSRQGQVTETQMPLGEVAGIQNDQIVAVWDTWRHPLFMS